MGTKRRQSHAARRPAGPSKGRGPAWFLTGALTGGLVVWVMLGHDPAAEQVRTAMERTVGHSIGIETATPQKPKIEYEFYSKLPEMIEEVVVPEEELGKPDPAPAESSATDTAGTADTAGATDTAGAADAAAADKEVPAPREDGKDAEGKDKAPLKPGHYVLQVASFRSVKDADGLKAKLILNGFNPVVQSVVISGEEKRYRVRLGPYTDRGSLEAARLRLRESGYDDPLVVRVSRG